MGVNHGKIDASCSLLEDGGRKNVTLHQEQACCSDSDHLSGTRSSFLSIELYAPSEYNGGWPEGFRGPDIPDGPLVYTSKHEPLPLDEIEKLLILLAVGGVTGCPHSVTRHDR